ncbi:MAG: hypothetical protein QME55_00895 [Brevundimonas sp.]|nr:hypothetical protein [Brevundimonas sp.]
MIQTWNVIDDNVGHIVTKLIFILYFIVGLWVLVGIDGHFRRRALVIGVAVIAIMVTDVVVGVLPLVYAISWPGLLLYAAGADVIDRRRPL